METVNQVPFTSRSAKEHVSIFAFALIMVIASRLLLYGTAYLGMNLFPAYTGVPAYESTKLGEQSYKVMQLPEYVGDTQLPKLAHLYKFDVYSYMAIAEHGYDRYRMDEAHPPANWVFFPLLPLAVKGFSYLVPWLSLHTAGVVLCNLLLATALYFLHLIALTLGLVKKDAHQILYTVLIYPASLYFSLMYTESLFFCLSAAAVYFSLTRRYFAAMLAAGLSTVTRVPGAANLLFAGGTILIDRIAAHGLRPRWRDLRYVLYAVLSLVPLAAYFAYMKGLTGNFLAPIHEQDNWGRAQALPFQSYFHYLRNPYFILGGGGWDNGVLSFGISTMVLLVFILYAVKHAKTLIRRPKELLFFVYGFILVVIPFSSSPTLLTSIVRYLMVSIPFYFYLHDLIKGYPVVRQFTSAALVTLNAVMVICFINDYFFVV